MFLSPEQPITPHSITVLGTGAVYVSHDEVFMFHIHFHYCVSISTTKVIYSKKSLLGLTVSDG